MLTLAANACTCVDELMATAVILANPARVAAAVRVLRSAACTALAVVTPVPTVLVLTGVPTVT